jgi:nucleotide-binding universal stress UspA family protein
MIPRSEVTLRRALPVDAPTIAEIWHLGWRDGHLGFVSQDLIAARHEDSFRTRAAQRVNDTTVAVVQGRIAGFVMVVDNEVEQVYVSALHRGEGVADMLMLRSRHGVPLRLTTFVVRDRQMYPSQVGYDAERLVAEQWRAQALEAQEKVLATLPDDVAVEAGIVEGRDWEDALDSLPWEEGEVLVVGLSRLGPVARVFLGSNPTKIIRSSPVPVVVIPRGAEVRLQDSAPAARGFELER